MAEKYQQRYCVMCDTRKAAWAIEQGIDDVEFVCGMHLTQRLTFLYEITEHGIFRVLTIDEHFIKFCMDCKRNIEGLREMYMVWDTVWLEACKDRHGMLCVGCIEKRLGRELVPGDFTHYPINTDFKGKSIRLGKRLGHHIKHGN